jgi:hypothetical protein
MFATADSQSVAATDLPFSDLYSGLAKERFSADATTILSAPLNQEIVEIRPDGIIYLPEIEYRGILLRAFGPGGWALVPRGDYRVQNGVVFREYALFCQGRFVAESYGEMRFDENREGFSIATAVEGAKSNALMRCCKDLGIASELWSPSFITQWKSQYAIEVSVETRDGKKRRFWRRLDRAPFSGYYRETGPASSSSSSSSSSFAPSSPSALSSSSSSYQNVSASPSTGSFTGARFNSDVNSQQQQQQQQPQPSVDGPVEFDVNADVPAYFRKYAGKKWADVIGDPACIDYLRWAEANYKDTLVRSMAREALQWAERNL